MDRAVKFWRAYNCVEHQVQPHRRRWPNPLGLAAVIAQLLEGKVCATFRRFESEWAFFAGIAQLDVPTRTERRDPPCIQRPCPATNPCRSPLLAPKWTFRWGVRRLDTDDLIAMQEG